MTWLGRVVRLLPILPLSLLCASCPGFFPSNSSVQSVVVTPTAVLLEAGAATPDTFTLSSTATSVGGTPTNDTDTASWASSNADVTVAKGVMTAAAAAASGDTAAITATDGGVASNPCNVLFYTGPITSIGVETPNGSTIAPGGSLQLTTTYNGGTTNIATYVSWITSDTSIATVSATGLVTLVGTPTAANFTVSATANLGTAATPRTVTSAPVTITIT